MRAARTPCGAAPVARPPVVAELKLNMDRLSNRLSDITDVHIKGRWSWRYDALRGLRRAACVHDSTSWPATDELVVVPRAAITASQIAYNEGGCGMPSAAQPNRIQNTAFWKFERSGEVQTKVPAFCCNSAPRVQIRVRRHSRARDGMSARGGATAAAQKCAAGEWVDRCCGTGLSLPLRCLLRSCYSKGCGERVEGRSSGT